MSEKFQINIPKTEGLVHICTDRRTIDLAHHAYHLYIDLIWSQTFRSWCYKLRGKLNIPSSGHKKALFSYVSGDTINIVTAKRTRENAL